MVCVAAATLILVIVNFGLNLSVRSIQGEVNQRQQFIKWKRAAGSGVRDPSKGVGASRRERKQWSPAQFADAKRDYNQRHAPDGVWIRGGRGKRAGRRPLSIGVIVLAGGNQYRITRRSPPGAIITKFVWTKERQLTDMFGRHENRTRPETSPLTSQLPLVFVLLSIFLLVVFQTYQSLHDRCELRSAQETAVQEGVKVRQQLETLVGRTAQLAADGDAGAREVVELMQRQGVKLTPPK
jgi:hypothetical protein